MWLSAPWKVCRRPMPHALLFFQPDLLCHALLCSLIPSAALTFLPFGVFMAPPQVDGVRSAYRRRTAHRRLPLVLPIRRDPPGVGRDPTVLSREPNLCEVLGECTYVQYSGRRFCVDLVVCL